MGNFTRSLTILRQIARLPTVVRRLLGAALAFSLAMSAFVSGVELMTEGPWWSVAALAGGAFLLVAAWRNWPVLWNALGQLLRALLGERSARVAFAVSAALFMLPGALGAALGALG